MKFGHAILAGAFLTIVGIGAAPASAQTNLPWCSTDKDGAMNCLYPTLAACETVIRPEGGECVPNPRSPK